MAEVEKAIDDHSSTSSDVDEGDDWLDVEDDRVVESFTSLFDDKTFDDLESMLNYCKANFQFDVWKLQQQHDLDFLGLVKLVNYVRRSVAEGTRSPDVSSKPMFDDDQYLLPVLESDAVLYNLEDVLTRARPVTKSRVEELEDELAALQVRFNAYRADVAGYLDDKINVSTTEDPAQQQTSVKDSIDADYFHSYSFNDIHETMLKDKVRTDAYRDFIYDNKHLFKDKVVLDVGCGTGILSMFCAQAGARQVIAVDNSNIIDNAREIIKINHLENKIQCVRGKIEEIKLPVDKVDIIVSEWMGYALLYESMLDSVLFARDKYLASDGLMVPSHATIRVGLLCDTELRQTCVDFWQDVYGFDMSTMAERARGECIIKVATPEEISGLPSTVKVLNLQTVTIKDLSFESKFDMSAAENSNLLDGFAVWFDIFFGTRGDAKFEELELDVAKSWGWTVFTTGPFGIPTHWQQGICLMDQPIALSQSRQVTGVISVDKEEKDTRALRISINWTTGAVGEKFQTWHVN